MNTIAAIAVVVCSVCTTFCVFMMFRTQWVGGRRIEMIRKDFHTYERMQSFNHMMWRFWIWDVEKFIRK